MKKRLNTPYYKQISDMKKMEKAGQEFNLIAAGIATPQERMEQLKVEYKVGLKRLIIINYQINFLFSSF